MFEIFNIFGEKSLVFSTEDFNFWWKIINFYMHVLILTFQNELKSQTIYLCI